MRRVAIGISLVFTIISCCAWGWGGWWEDILSGNFSYDGSIYQLTTPPATTGGAGFYVKQPDGGCSKCGVDNAGTTWACVNVTCVGGM